MLQKVTQLLDASRESEETQRKEIARLTAEKDKLLTERVGTDTLEGRLHHMHQQLLAVQADNNDVVAALVGRRYMRTAGAVGAALWFHATALPRLEHSW